MWYLGRILPYFTYLGKEGDKFPKCLDLGLIERAQEGKHHYFLRVGVPKLDDM